MKKTILAALALGMSALVPVARATEKSAMPAVISHGAKVTLTDHLVAGNITVFDFSSKYCPSCVALSPKLDMVHAKIPNLVVVKVDINRASTKGIDWKSPVAQQYKLHEIPHVKIYDDNGKLVAEDDAAMTMIQSLIDVLGGKYNFIPKFQRLLILNDENGRPYWYFSNGEKKEEQTAHPSTENAPKFKNAAANEYVKAYSDYANEFFAAIKARDTAKLKTLFADRDDWSAKASAVSKNMKDAAAQRFMDWVAIVTSEMNTAIVTAAENLKKGKKGAKGKGGPKG